MKWADSTRQPYSEIISKYQRMVALQVGGHHDGIWDDCLRDFPHTFKTIRNHNAVTARSFGRATRPQPRTLPWLVALPLFLYLWWGGEL
jgi:hypothetical protein